MYGSGSEGGGLEAEELYELLKADVLLLLLCITNGAGVDPVGTILVPLFVTLKPSNAEDLRENRIKKRKDQDHVSNQIAGF